MPSVPHPTRRRLLAAGAFAMAGIIYVFQRKDLYGLGRTAVLMGLLSYSFVMVTLLADLGTICLNTITPADPALPGFRLVTTPTTLQRQAFELLGVTHRLGVA